MIVFVYMDYILFLLRKIYIKIIRHKIVIIIKSLCDAILLGQQKIKKVSILHYSIDIS